MRSKKGVLGLNTVRAVMLLILVVAVIALTIILTMVSLRDVAEDLDLDSGSTNNESITPTSVGSGASLTPATDNRENRQCTVVSINNHTAVIQTGNYTESNCFITNLTSEILSTWNVTYTWSYSAPTTRNVERNVTEGVVDFFTNTGTIFAILIVVVIILAIAIIIAVVSRFGGGTGIRRAGATGGREAGTLMGI